MTVFEILSAAIRLAVSHSLNILRARNSKPKRGKSMSQPTIAVVGASNDRRKFGNRAVRAYARQGWDVYPVNPRESLIEGRRVYRAVRDLPMSQIDRVSLYVPPAIGLRLIEEIARMPPRELWLNPGAESPELIARGSARPQRRGRMQHRGYWRITCRLTAAILPCQFHTFSALPPRFLGGCSGRAPPARRCPWSGGAPSEWSMPQPLQD